MFERLIWTGFGVLWLVVSLRAGTRLSPPFRRSPAFPPTRMQRVILFLMGLVSLARGLFEWFAH
jgi:hypothetical protein